MGDAPGAADGGFVGFARIDLAKLHYNNEKLSTFRTRCPESVRRRVDNLVRIFKTEGCVREERHAIHIVVERGSIPIDGLSKSLPVTVEELKSLDTTALCIQGVHRVLAGLDFLPGNDQWWIARVYTQGSQQHSIGRCSSARLTGPQRFLQKTTPASSKTTITNSLDSMG
jgi:hypothetical protein